MKNLFFILLFLCCFFNGYAQKSDAKFRFNLSGGIAYDVTSSSDDEKTMIDLGFNRKEVKKLVNDLRLGVQGNADVHYLFNEHFGVGVKYSFYMNDGELSRQVSLLPTTGYDSYDIKIEEKDYLNYIGPSAHFRTLLGNSAFTLSTTLSVGYVYLRSEMPESTLFESPVIAHRGRIGTYNGVGLEYSLNKKLAIGVDLNYLYTSFDRMYYKTSLYGTLVDFDLELDKTAVISRFDLSIGIKVYL
jgi:hypothetical protein